MSLNMPILWQNCIEQYRTEVARKAWVWFAETRGAGMQYEADKYAAEVDNLVEVFGFCTSKATHRPDGEKLTDLIRFVLTRHANLRFGSNVKPYFLA